MPDGQNGVLDFWNWNVNANTDLSTVTAPVALAPQVERPAFVLQPFKWGSGTRGTSGGTITWSMGAQIASDAPYTSSVRTISAEFQATIRAAFARWDAVGNFTFVEVADSSTANMSVVFDELAAEGSGTLGIANTSYFPSTGVSDRVFIRFDIGRTWRNMEGASYAVGTASGSPTNLYSVALHEIGHALGLDHEDDFATLMNAYYSADINDLTNDEIAGIQQLYGTGGSAPVTPTVPTADDYAASTSTTGTVAVGGSVTGNIGTANDVDWFRVTLTASVTYRIDLRGTTLADPLVGLRNSSGTRLTSDDDSGTGLDAMLSYTPTTTGTYYIDAQGASAGDTGTYMLSVTQTSASADDYAGSASTTGVIAPGGSVTGNIETVGDNDWFRITLTAGTSYRFDLRAGTLHDPYLTLFNASGTSLAINDDTSTSLDSQLIYTSTTTGVYYLSARSAPGAVSGTGMGTYTLTATLTSAVDDYAASTATIGALTVGGSATGAFETSQDADWFRISLTAGQTYQIDVRGSASSGGTMADPSVSLYGFTGAFIAFDADSGTGADARLTFTATTSGTYYIAAEALSAGTGTYTVSASIAQTGDFAATTATTASVAVGATLASSIEQAGDVDWIRVTLTAGTLYQFDGRGTATFGGTLADPSMQLLNSSGAVVRSDNNSGADNDSRILYTATASGTYYIAMRSNAATATGTYTVGVTANPDDFTATTATAGVATVGGTTSGTTEVAGDRDWFRAILTAGTSYAIEVRGTSPGSGLRWTQSSVVLRDGTGAQLAADTKSGLGAAARLIYTPTTTGAFYVDTLAYSTGVGAYNVTVTAASSLTAPVMSAQAQQSSVGVELSDLTAPPAIDLWDLPAEAFAPTPVQDALFAIPAPYDFNSPEDEHRLTNAARFEALFQLPQRTAFDLLPLG